MDDELARDDDLRHALRTAYPRVEPAVDADSVMANASAPRRQLPLVALAGAAAILVAAVLLITIPGDRDSSAPVIADQPATDGVPALRVRITNDEYRADALVAHDGSQVDATVRIDLPPGAEPETTSTALRVLVVDGHEYHSMDETRGWIRRETRPSFLTDLLGHEPSVLVDPAFAQVLVTGTFETDARGRVVEYDHPQDAGRVEVLDFATTIAVSPPPEARVVDDPAGQSSYVPSPECDARRNAMITDPAPEDEARAFMDACLDETALDPDTFGDTIARHVLADRPLPELTGFPLTLDDLETSCGPVVEARVRNPRYLDDEPGSPSFEVRVDLTTEQQDLTTPRLVITIDVVTGQISSISTPGGSGSCG